jgi:hypothetical protein
MQSMRSKTFCQQVLQHETRREVRNEVLNVSVASSLPTEIQYAVITHLNSILDLLNTGDYSNDRHDGTWVGWLANSTGHTKGELE